MTETRTNQVLGRIEGVKDYLEANRGIKNWLVHNKRLLDYINFCMDKYDSNIVMQAHLSRTESLVDANIADYYLKQGDVSEKNILRKAN